MVHERCQEDTCDHVNVDYELFRVGYDLEVLHLFLGRFVADFFARKAQYIKKAERDAYKYSCNKQD